MKRRRAGRVAARSLWLLLAIALAGCSGSGAASTPPRSDAASPQRTSQPVSGDTIKGTGDYLALQAARPAVSPEDASRAATSLNALGFDLYRGAAPGNLVLSPTSIALALAMARPGARGATAEQMDAAMHDLASAANLPRVGSLERSLAALTGTFDNPKTRETQQVTLRIANTSFAQRGMAMQKEYLAVLAATFGAGIHLTDYSADPEAARRAINAWVAQQTENRIKELIPAGDLVNTNTRLALVNAIYLKAPWLEPFAKDATRPGTFTTSSGRTTIAQMMREASTRPYARGAGWEAVDVPYVGGSLSMTLILPDDLAAFDTTLDATTFASIVSSLRPRDVDLSMPRFKLEAKTELAKQLATLGMKDAFDPDRADFSGITTDESLFIRAVVHQANIDVDESGTEATAATAVLAELTAMPSDRVAMTLDRPFVFALRDRTTGAILFLGRVTDPAAA